MKTMTKFATLAVIAMLMTACGSNDVTGYVEPTRSPEVKAAFDAIHVCQTMGTPTDSAQVNATVVNGRTCQDWFYSAKVNGIGR